MASIAAVVFTIVVRLYVGSPADLAILAEAQPVATALLARAGVTPQWIVCRAGEHCEAPIEGDILVRFRPDRLDDTHHCGNAVGTGLVPSGLVTLYVGCIDAGADRLHVPRRVIAGYSLAHEMGHLLLRRRGHAMSGLMAAQPDWRFAAAGGLQFDGRDVAAIQGALAGSAAAREERRAAAAANAQRNGRDAATTGR